VTPMRIQTFCLILIFVFLTVIGTACERKTRDMAQAKKDLAAPEYKSEAKLVTVADVSHVKEVMPGEEVDGATLFAKNCSVCHQISGKGTPGAFPPLDGSSYVTSDNVDRMASIMIYGLSGPIKVSGVEFNSAMAPLGKTLNDEELAKIATYIRSAWSNKAGEVKSNTFAEARKKWGERGMFNITELGEEQ